MYPYVHSSTIHNSQDMERRCYGKTQMNFLANPIYIMEYYSAKKRMQKCHLQQHGET